MVFINKILRFADIFNNAAGADSIESMLWDGSPPSASKPTPVQKQVSQTTPITEIPGYTRLKETPDTDVQQTAQRILNRTRNQPIGTTYPFSMNGIDYLAKLETHPPGPKNPKTHPGISLFVKNKPRSRIQQNQQFRGIAQLSERTESKIAELAPKFQPIVREFMKRGLQEGLRPEIVDARRSQDKQNELYEQGRTKPGPIVTWTRDSMHTKGLAVDIAQLDENGNINWNAPDQFWNKMGRIGKSLGMKWGGDFKNKDRPHFQYVPKTN